MAMLNQCAMHGVDRQTDSCKSVLLVEKSAAEKEETDEESVLSQILQNNRVLDVINGGTCGSYRV